MSSEKPVWKDLTTADRLAIVKPLWLKGRSAGDIAFEFIGATRSAVIGMVHRAKLGRAAPKNSQRAVKPLPNPRKPTVKRVSAAVTNRPIRVGKISAAPPPAAKEPTADIRTLIDTNRPPLNGIEPLTILELPTRERGICRFPVIGGYCGIHVHDEDRYCEAHERLMYSPESLAKLQARRAKRDGDGTGLHDNAGA